MPEALLAAAAALLAFLLFSYVVVITARLHARVARGLLRPPPSARQKFVNYDDEVPYLVAWQLIRPQRLAGRQFRK